MHLEVLGGQTKYSKNLHLPPHSPHRKKKSKTKQQSWTEWSTLTKHFVDQRRTTNLLMSQGAFDAPVSTCMVVITRTLCLQLFRCHQHDWDYIHFKKNIYFLPEIWRFFLMLPYVILYVCILFRLPLPLPRLSLVTEWGFPRLDMCMYCTCPAVWIRYLKVQLVILI